MKQRLTIIILSTIILILLAAGIPLYNLVANNNSEETIDDIIERSVDIVDIITNNKSNDFIRVSFKIQADHKDAKDELEKRNFQINNLIIKHLSNLESKDLATTEGKANLEQDLKMKFNSILTTGKVEEVYITQFIIQ